MILYELSEEGINFLRKCFVKDPLKRWTDEMLLNHPFILDDEIVLNSKDESPLLLMSSRTHFDFFASSTKSTLPPEIP